MKLEPNSYKFGTEFNYSLWTNDTVVTMFNVPFDSAYRDIVNFGGPTEFNKYIDALDNSTKLQITRMSRVNYGEPVRVDVPFNVAIQYNYLRASNPVMPISGDIPRDYYYFILDVRYIAPNTTELILQVDYWQSFGHLVKFGNCYIEQGHIGIANENGLKNNGRDYLTKSEGIDLGNSMSVLRAESINFGEVNGVGNTGNLSANKSGYVYYVASAASLHRDIGTEKEPKYPLAKGVGVIKGVGNHIDEVMLDRANYRKLVDTAVTWPWAGQSILMVELVPDPLRYTKKPTKKTGNSKSLLRNVSYYDYGAANVPYAYHKKLDGFRDMIMRNVGERYRNLHKFTTAPYAFIEMASTTGSSVTLNPELVLDEFLDIAEIAGYAPGQTRISFFPYSYNGNTRRLNDFVAQAIGGSGDGFQYAIHITNFPKLMIANDQGLASYASQAHSIASARANAGYGRERAMLGAATAYDQATSAINLSQSLTEIGVNATNQTTAIQNAAALQSAQISGAYGVGGAALGGIGAIASGGVAGIPSAAMGMLQAGMSRQQQLDQVGVQNSARSRSAAVSASAQLASQGKSGGHSAFVRDSNRTLAEWAANGDYAATIRALDAQIADTMNTPPSVTGAIGGEYLLTSNNSLGAKFYLRVVDKAHVRSIGEYWLRYGYVINEFVTPPANLKVMEKFSYWKMKNVYLIGSTVAESVKNVIRGIFEKGVTVWDNPSDIGVTDIANNEPLKGVKY